jgi:rhodanese-related sulfurtransferase|tara:strand:+ start:9135 stop:9548 length:414 start_codon:yes stop_codon:yes gene_type:complete
MKYYYIIFIISFQSFAQQKNDIKNSSSLYSNDIDKSTVELVGVEFSKELIKKQIKIIDVRTPKEFNQGHIENAININFKSSNFIKSISKLNKDTSFLIYCKSGNRSGKAAKIFDSIGFYKIYDLKGGYINWNIKANN